MTSNGTASRGGEIEVAGEPGVDEIGLAERVAALEHEPIAHHRAVTVQASQQPPIQVVALHTGGMDAEELARRVDLIAINHTKILLDRPFHQHWINAYLVDHSPEVGGVTIRASPGVSRSRYRRCL